MQLSAENTNKYAIMCQNFRRLRESKGLTLDTLSVITGIDEKILADIESGEDFEMQYFLRYTACTV